ncbi:MAG: carbamoyltransferase [Bryobacterales bacterium]|nr:carbamoyltransferase [Bryobacterales bacterium]
MIILGIGGILNDPAVALLNNGVLAAAVEQKKVARTSRAGELPEEAIAECLRLAGVTPEQVECTALARPLGLAAEAALHLNLRALFPNAQLVVVDHHTAHAASAYYASPFESATVLTFDRLGDLRCGAIWAAEGTDLRVERELYYPDSLGDLYGRVTALLGFHQSADEHKVQWLSCGGTDRFAPLFLDILQYTPGKLPRVDRSYYDNHRLSNGGFSAKFHERLGLAGGGAPPAAMHADIAAGVQKAVETVVLDMAGKGENLCMAGGLAFNALLVAALERSGHWKQVFVQPASGNTGTAIGAVYHAWHRTLRNPRSAPMQSLLLGPEYSSESIKQVLENCKLRFKYLLTTGELIERAVEELNTSKIIAWMHGRMEFGPRALGNRSILASPLNPYSTENLNSFIKHREPFRKFACSVPSEIAGEYFEAGPNARNLATVGRVKPSHRKTFEPAVLGDGLVRVHVVRREENQVFWELLHAFGRSTGLPVLFNTSFNLFSDPLVCSPRDAVRSFYSSGIDSLFVGQFQLQK